MSRGRWAEVGRLGGASVAEMQCVRLLATGSANFAVKTNCASPCARVHRVDYAGHVLKNYL